MQEITPKKAYEPPEIRVIDPKRTSLVPVRMAVIIYVLQAGPI